MQATKIANEIIQGCPFDQIKKNNSIDYVTIRNSQLLNKNNKKSQQFRRIASSFIKKSFGKGLNSQDVSRASFN